MKRRTKAQWHQYHKEKAELAASAAVEARFVKLLSVPTRAAEAERKRLADALSSEDLASRFKAFFGIESAYRKSTIDPIERRISIYQQQIYDLLNAKSIELKKAREQAVSDYEEARLRRRQDAEARAVRVEGKKKERHIRYLEQSPSIRSAARFFRRLLLGQHAVSGQVQCFYCGRLVPESGTHLEHKRPVVRGGDNRRSNLVLACSSCNLKKGRKTHEEFIRTLIK